MGWKRGEGIGSAFTLFSLESSPPSHVVSALQGLCGSSWWQVMVPGPCSLPSKFLSFPQGFTMTAFSEPPQADPAWRGVLSSLLTACCHLLWKSTGTALWCLEKLMLSRWALHSLSTSVSLSLSPAERKEAFLDNYSPREPKDCFVYWVFLVTTREVLRFFLALGSFSFLFLVAEIEKMTKFPINRALGNFKIVKDTFLPGHDCWILGIRNAVRCNRWNPGSGLTSGLRCTQVFRVFYLQGVWGLVSTCWGLLPLPQTVHVFILSSDRHSS